MSTGSRKKEHKENLRALIIEKAFRIISETGYENLNMRLLAQRIDYSPRTIYLYFKNKEALLDALIEKVFFETLTAMNADVNGDTAPKQIFLTMINRHIRNGLQQPLLYRAVTSGIGREGYCSSSSAIELNERIGGLLRKLLPPESTGDTRLITEIILASLRGTTLMLINKLPELDAEQIEKSISIYSEIILRGVL